MKNLVNSWTKSFFLVGRATRTPCEKRWNIC